MGTRDIDKLTDEIADLDLIYAALDMYADALRDDVAERDDPEFADVIKRAEAIQDAITARRAQLTDETQH